MARVTLNLSDPPAPEKVRKARRVVKAMTGNPHLPKPDPTLEKAMADALEAAARLIGVPKDKDADLDATRTASASPSRRSAAETRP